MLVLVRGVRRVARRGAQRECATGRRAPPRAARTTRGYSARAGSLVLTNCYARPPPLLDTLQHYDKCLLVPMTQPATVTKTLPEFALKPFLTE